MHRFGGEVFWSHSLLGHGCLGCHHGEYGEKITQKGWVTPAELGSEPRSLDDRAAGSPTAGSQTKGLPKTRGARLIWLAPAAGKV